MSFYKDNIEVIIKKYKTAMSQCLAIVDKKIDSDLSDDKLHNALKGKRMAAEDAKWYAKEVDALENEMNGTEKPKEEEVSTKNPAEARAMK